MGPGTHIIERLERKDPPRTLSDKTAELHDINYTLATKQHQIRDADIEMIHDLNNISKNKTDSNININLGRLAIKGKIALEDAHILNNQHFSGPLGAKHFSEYQYRLLTSNSKRLRKDFRAL